MNIVDTILELTKNSAVDGLYYYYDINMVCYVHCHLTDFDIGKKYA